MRRGSSGWLTTLLQGVALLQVSTGPGRVFPAAVGAPHAVNLAAQGLERGLDPWVGLELRRVAVGQGLVLAELWRGRGAHVVILGAPEHVVHGGGGGPGGTREARGA